MSAHPSTTLVPADLPIRLLARAIDAVILVAIDAGLGQVIGFGYDWLLIGATMVLAYFVLLDTLAGTTPGKFVLGLRVIGPDGERPSLSQAMIRESFAVLGAIPFVGPPLALAAWSWIAVTVGSSALRQGKHDLLAGGTRVVRTRPTRDADALLTPMLPMSDADLSVLDACLATPGNNVTTSPGSQNDKLWSQMVNWGWMTVKEEVVDVPGRQLRMKVYSNTAQGVEPVARLLQAVRTMRA